MDDSHSEHETGADSGGLRAQPHVEVMTITDVTMWLEKEGFAEDVLSAFEGESLKSSQSTGGGPKAPLAGRTLMAPQLLRRGIEFALQLSAYYNYCGLHLFLGSQRHSIL